MKPSLFSRPLSLALAVTAALSLVNCKSALAVEPSPVATVMGGSFALDGEDKQHDIERKDIENSLSAIEAQWNAHDLSGLMANYADDYVNNDGLNKKAVQKLTEEFWKTYPDAHSVSKTKQIRIEGNFATVESRDTALGTTEMKGLGKGELQSVSEGQQYMKRLGTEWKIIGERTDYEKVKVAFGLAQHLNATFTAPEQVKSGKQFTAKLEVTLPPGLIAIGSITNQPLVFPQPESQEKPRQLDTPSILERVMPANSDNHNELLTATVSLINPDHTVIGASFLTRRLNVVPNQSGPKDDTTMAQTDAGDKIASESGKESKEPAKVVEEGEAGKSSDKKDSQSK